MDKEKIKNNIVLAICTLLFCLIFLNIVARIFDATPKDIKNLVETTKFDKQKCAKIFEILNSVGIPSIDEVKCSEYSEGFNCKISEYDWFDRTIWLQISPEGVVNKVEINSKVLYENNKVLAQALDCTITIDDVIYLVNNSIEKTKMVLKSPSTAIFPEWKNWAIGLENNVVNVSGYVDSQNQFGAMVRTEVEFQYNRNKKYNDEYEYTFKSAKIDGVLMGK